MPNEMKNVLKKGIYRELHKRKYINKHQLTRLLAENK